MDNCTFEVKKKKTIEFQGSPKEYKNWQNTPDWQMIFKFVMYIIFCIGLLVGYIFEAIYATKISRTQSNKEFDASSLTGSFIYTHILVISCLFYILYISCFKQLNSRRNFQKIPHQFLFWASCVIIILCLVPVGVYTMSEAAQKTTGQYIGYYVLWVLEIIVIVVGMGMGFYYKLFEWDFVQRIPPPLSKIKNGLFHMQFITLAFFSLLILSSFSTLCFTFFTRNTFDDYLLSWCFYLIPILSSFFPLIPYICTFNYKLPP